MPDPGGALDALANQLREEGTLLSANVVDSEEQPVFGLLAAAGPRAKQAPWEYALLTEAIREGYLLHYDRSRLLTTNDPDLALLAGDYLYALGLDRLAALEDVEAVHELSDLISLCAQLSGNGRDAELGDALWLAAITAVTAGASPAHEEAKRSLREGHPDVSAQLRSAAAMTAASSATATALERAAEAVGFASLRDPDFG